MSDLRGFHGSGVGHADGVADLGPGVAGGSRVGDELGAAGGHGVHAGLERGEGLERIICHGNTVTQVAEVGLACYCSYMHKEATAATIKTDDTVIFPGRKQPVTIIATWPGRNGNIEIAGWNRGRVALVMPADTKVQVIQ